MEPLAPPAPPPPAPALDVCARCGAPPYDRFQEYCLECGARLQTAYAPAYISQREVWSRESPVWLWAALAALLVIALFAGGIVLAAATRDEEPVARGTVTTAVVVTGTTPTAPPPTVTVGPITGTVTVPTLPPPVVPPPVVPPPVIPPPVQPPPAQPPPAQPPPAQPGTIMAWPAGRAGYTVVLASVPTGNGRAGADAHAQDAIAAGLTQVGVLNSANYGSLKAGYFVVFSGVYNTETDAQNALPTVRASGFPLAYVREITP